MEAKSISLRDEKTILFATFSFMLIPLRSAHTRRPAYTLRLYLLLHQSLETQHCRSYKVPIPWTQGPQGPPQENPRAPPHPHPHPHTQGRGGEGAQGPRGPLGKMGPWGPLGLFRSHSEWQVIPKPVRMERPFRMDGCSEWRAIPCVHSAAKTTNRKPADLFGWI